MKIYYMKQKALDSLQKDIPENLKKYQSNACWIEQYFIEKEAPKYYFETGIEVPDYELSIGGPETDFQNAKIIFEAFKDKLNPVQASDLRLWAYLAHAKHWDYMHNRWKINVPDDDDEEKEDEKSSGDKMTARVKTRYFFGVSRSKAYVRHGIARLYWSAYLTYDESNPNPYEFTEFFLSKQDVFTSITERSYAHNKTILLAALKELKKHTDLSRDDTRLFLAKLNHAGAITVLDYLDAQQAGQLCEKLMKEVLSVPCLKEGSVFSAFNDISGKAYGPTLKIINGKTTVFGKPINVKPQNLIGRKEGAKITISGQSFVIKGIQQ